LETTVSFALSQASADTEISYEHDDLLVRVRSAHADAVEPVSALPDPPRRHAVWTHPLSLRSDAGNPAVQRPTGRCAARRSRGRSPSPRSPQL